VAYDVAVLTNITSEHLEFHRTLDAYRAAKRRLFEWLAPGIGRCLGLRRGPGGRHPTDARPRAR
jgi:UDP-N-acetylmuramoyl-L-alanyl-D-glutamate--2,6-diaminopimelate ligase